jgi:hypothetical protein
MPVWLLVCMPCEPIAGGTDDQMVRRAVVL